MLRVVPGVVVLFGALLACKGKPDPSVVKASCDMRAGASGSTTSSSICMDFHVEPNDKVRAICSPTSGYIMAPTACDRTASLGGCRKGNLTNWYYASGVHSSADDVKKECPSEFVTP